MISVILPMYNSQDTIIQVITSIINQTRFDLVYEIIVVDDGSKDNSLKKVAQYAKSNPSLPIKMVSKSNSGASSARNLGLRMATAEYIAFIDSDDIWLPNKIEKQMEIFAENDDIYFLGTNYVGGKLKIPFKKVPRLFRATAKDICWCNFPVTPSVVFKREVIATVGYFDENQFFGEDINYYQKIGAQYNYYFLNEELVIIGIHKRFFGENGLTSNMKQMHKGTLKNIAEMYQTKQIDVGFYVLMRMLYTLKYIRRRIIRRVQNNIRADRPRY